MNVGIKHGRQWAGSPWRVAMWAAIGGLLVLPLVAMQFTREVAWTPFDFAAAAALLVGGGLAYEIAARKAASPRSRLLLGGVILGVVLLIWAEGAVGILS